MGVSLPHEGIFFEFCRERELVRVKKESGEPPPWTEDVVLRQFRFCNVHREDDRTTRWFRDNIRRKMRNQPDVLFATVAFRWFNRIETGMALRDILILNWNPEVARRRLGELAARGPVVTGAYVIKTPTGRTKGDGIVDCLQKFRQRHMERILRYLRGPNPTLQGTWVQLMEVPYLGPFMAYEIVTDLYHTRLLERAPDIFSWANPGPGCTRGLGWIVANDPTKFRYPSPKGQDLLHHMRNILAASGDPANWPLEWQPWDMRTVEHTLCEFDKWQRGRQGETLKRRYP